MSLTPAKKILMSCSEFSSLLGTYRFLSGDVTPAIAVLPTMAYQYPPTGTEIEGLEALVIPYQDYSATLSGYIVLEAFTLILKQFELTKNCSEAIKAIARIPELTMRRSVSNNSSPEVVRADIEICSYAISIY